MNPNWFDYYALPKGPFSHSATATLVFRLKLLGLMAHLQKSKTLGNLSAYVWRIEYQKRGLPHAHILLWTDFDTTKPIAVEKVVNVRLPKNSPFTHEQQLAHDLHSLILKFQVHGHSPRCAGKTGPCKFRYAQPVSDKTVIGLGKQYLFARSPGAEQNKNAGRCFPSRQMCNNKLCSQKKEACTDFNKNCLYLRQGFVCLAFVTSKKTRQVLGRIDDI
jgi:hypothetical protein